MTEQNSEEEVKEVTLDDFDDTYKLSDQAISSLVMILQKGIAERKDITEEMKNLTFVESPDGLFVTNTPTFEIDFDQEIEEEVENEGDESELVTEEDL